VNARLAALFLMIPGTLVHAEPEAQAPANRADLRALLEDPNGDLARLAKGALGKRGGNQLFYLPTRDEPQTPAQWGLKYESVNFSSADGTNLHGWFVPPKSGKPKGTIVFSHGNAGSLGHHLGFVMWLAEAGYNILMYDYRGFGRSGGSVDRRGMINDVKAAFAYTGKRPDVDSRRLISFGHSLGGAKSVTALGEQPVKGLRAVVIDGAFASYQSMARLIGGQLGASLISDELSPKDYVEKLSPVPLLVVHGVRDEVVPFAQGRQLFDSAKQPKTLFEVKAGRHGDSLARDGGDFRKRMLVWLDKSLKDS
jgi:dipeptidyl aminopeptidase/acylaminoacyl peptidase